MRIYLLTYCHYILLDMSLFTIYRHFDMIFQMLFYVRQTFIVSKHVATYLSHFFLSGATRARHTDRQSVSVCVREEEKDEFAPTSDDIRARVSPRTSFSPFIYTETLCLHRA